MTPRRAFRVPVSQTHDQREIAEEIASHIDEKTKRLIAQGMSAEEARREAERSFGDIERLTAAMTRCENQRGCSLGVRGEKLGVAKHQPSPPESLSERP